MLATLVFAIGAAMAVLVPYVLKVREEAIKFDMRYFYGLLVSVIIAAIAAMPSEVDVSVKGLGMIFLAGLGLQSVMNKGVKILKK